ncbi:MAG TPA: TylF/MycF/NovP-related O-methyltransferase [Gemmataceae bacterium]|nr:TylF/MycF/NovP-related O-methyltransferase [Gemmataceae bacterium]
MRSAVNWLIGHCGWEFRRIPPAFPPDFSLADIEDIRAVQQFTMTSAERIYALIRAVEYLVRHRIPGDVVECGVWKGGNIVTVARMLLRMQDADRHLWLFDTFDGMSEPGDVDVSYANQPARDYLKTNGADDWLRVPLEEVKKKVLSTGYDERKIHFVKGRVEETLPLPRPPQISLLRLDTDWYESTRHELVHLFPHVVSGGVLIIDDYGHWRGAQKAVDEYFENNRISILLNRIDYSARIGIKP